MICKFSQFLPFSSCPYRYFFCFLVGINLSDSITLRLCIWFGEQEDCLKSSQQGEVGGFVRGIEFGNLVFKSALALVKGGYVVFIQK